MEASSFGEGIKYQSTIEIRYWYISLIEKGGKGYDRGLLKLKRFSVYCESFLLKGRNFSNTVYLQDCHRDGLTISTSLNSIIYRVLRPFMFPTDF